MTRGAIYWHFEDKKALFRAVVDYNLERGDITEYGKKLPAELTYTDRLAEMFWYALNDNPHVEFIFKIMNFASTNPEFADVVEKIQGVKRRLWERPRSLCGCTGRHPRELSALHRRSP